MAKLLPLIFWISLTALSLSSNVAAQTTEFVYQGQLQNSSALTNGSFDFEFLLFDTLAGANQIGSTLTQSGVVVTNGIFSVKLDFGANYPGANRFLEIHVRPVGGGGFTPLTPRQPVTSSPYSVKSLNADNATNALQLGGIAANQYVLTTDPRMTNARPPTAGSSDYIQSNAANAQVGASFNISSGVAAIELGATTVKASEYWANGSPIVTTRGTNNFFVGNGVALVGNPGTDNSFFGTNTGHTNTGSFNSFFGQGVAPTNLGSFNSSFGHSTGEGMTNTANSNSFFGYRAGNFNSSGSGNTYIGANANPSQLATTGDNNTMLGTNTTLGTSSSNNTILGAGASIPTNGVNNSTVIGTGATASASNTIVIGRATETTLVTGKFKMLSPANGFSVAESFELNNVKGLIADHLVFRDLDLLASPVHLCYRVTSTGGSDGGYGLTSCTATLTSMTNKSDIQPFSGGLDVIERLQPVSFKWKANGTSDVGLNAEDVAEVAPSLVSRGDEGKILDVKENSLNVLFINAIKEQEAQIESQQKQIEQQKGQIEILKKIVCANSKAEICRQ